eukprot:gene7534-11858_t
MTEEDEVDDFFNKNIAVSPANKKRKIKEKENKDEKIQKKKKKKIERKEIEHDLFQELNEIEKTSKSETTETIEEELQQIPEIKKEKKEKKKISGLDALLNKMTEKSKSTIQKSKKDWEKYKLVSGTKSEVEKYAKDGYVEEKNFIQRTDVRQFEIERDLRLQQQEKKRFENQ